MSNHMLKKFSTLPSSKHQYRKWKMKIHMRRDTTWHKSHPPLPQFMIRLTVRPSYASLSPVLSV